LPAQISVTHAQLETLAAEGHNVILIEMPGKHEDEPPLEAWVIDDESQGSSSHRTIIVEQDGNILSDMREHD
jgi:hypothetical protein